MILPPWGRGNARHDANSNPRTRDTHNKGGNKKGHVGIHHYFIQLQHGIIPLGSAWLSIDTARMAA